MWWHLKANVVILQLLIAGASCFVNVAHTPAQGLQGTATMSEPPHSTGWLADKVVDGNTVQTASGGSCAIMDFNQNYKSVWLKVQLGRRFNVAYIELYLRNERLLDRSAGFSIYAFYNDTFDPASPSPNDLVYHHNPMSGCPAAVQNITINRLVRQIVFTNNRPDGFQTNCIGTNSNLYTSIEICEIKVMGCDTGRYSTGCLSVCPSCKNKNCDAFNGSCVDKCPDPNALTESCIVCADGQYISNGNCVNCKGHCKNGEHCNKLTGECDSGCATQWTGNFCDQCKDHFYGSDCITPCGHCLNNDTCDKGTGQCLNGCMPYWQMNKCDICSDHFYGIDCNTPCGHCINNDVCDKATGHCPRGCQSHWTGDRCDVCTDHFYGKDCNKMCGHCMNNSVCDKGTGRCPYGCQAQWMGEKCDVCIDHFYGNDCNTPCGKCKNYSMCDKGTGHCPNGCQSHWKGEQCNICNDHFYGQNCNISCGHCKNNGGCNNITGQCPDGCQANWQGEKCDECTDGFYNANCTERCGHCTDSEVCDKQNGSCVNGCIQNFQMPLCQECVDGFYNITCSTKCGNCLSGVCNKLSGACDTGCQRNFQSPMCQDCIDGFYNNSCNITCGKCKAKAVCDKNNGSCPDGCDGSFHPPLCKVRMEKESEVSEINKGAVAGGAVSILVVLVSVGVVSVIYRRDTSDFIDEDLGMKLQATLQLALQSSDFDAIKSIVENDTFDVNWRDVTHDLQSLVMKLCYVNLSEKEVIQILDAILEKDPDLNLQDSHGRTALMHACIGGKEELADWLISDPTTRIEVFDFDGNSALSHAVRGCSDRTVRRLLDHPNGHLLQEVYNSFGQRPIEIAEKHESKDIFNLLASYQNQIKQGESPRKKLVLPPAFSPQNETALRMAANKNTSMSDVEKLTPRSTYIDDETPNLYLTSSKLSRKKHRRSIDSLSVETSLLPAIKPTSTMCVQKRTPRDHKDKLSVDSKQRERRNSISLPDLRDSPGGLVASGGNSPYGNDDDYSSDSDFSDDAIVDLSSLDKPTDRVVKRSASEKHIGFPNINKGKEGTKVKRTLTEGSVYSNSDSKLNRLKLLQKSVLS